MKRMLLIFALSVFCFASAQKGTVLVGGNISYDTRTFDTGEYKSKTNLFEFSPKAGYQFHDNWTVGAEFAISHSKSNDSNNANETKSNAYKMGAFLRYTLPLSETFSVFADLATGFHTYKGKTYYDNSSPSEAKADGVYANITPALFINMKKGFGLNFSIGGLGYKTTSYDNLDADESSFYFNFGKTVNIGVSKNF